MGKVDIRVVECKNLANKDRFGKSDPYIKLTVAGKTEKTVVAKNDLNPKYDAKFSFGVADEKNASLLIEVFDKDTLTADDPMGNYTVNLSALIKDKVSDSWYVLNGCKSGEIHLRILTDFGLPGDGHAAGTGAAHSAPAGYPPAPASSGCAPGYPPPPGSM
eukprot:Rhum_TRINITY_DN14031_c1_g1::Rhum_TRINITY_DN14031_c1_g1_i1::g.66956::m.66956